MTSADTSLPSFDPTFAEPKKGALRTWLAPFAVVLALLSAFLTFVVLTGATRITPTRDVAVTFMLINGATILVLIGFIFRELWEMVQARRRGRAAARLHFQVVGLFSVFAVFPAVLVAIVANLTIDRGLHRLFSGPTRGGAHDLPGVMIIDKDGALLQKADTGAQLSFPPPPADFLSNVTDAEPEIS